MTNTFPTTKITQHNTPVKSSTSNSPLTNKEGSLNVRQAARIISQLILEIARGDRPLRHIRPWVDPAGYELLSQKIGIILQLRQNIPPVARHTPVIKALCILPISHSVYEVSVVARSHSRFRALALRLEEKPPAAGPVHKSRLSAVASESWKATAVEIG